MTLSELKGLLRATLRDTAEPYLWPDDLLVDYLNRAAVEFVHTAGAPTRTVASSMPAGATKFDRKLFAVAASTEPGKLDPTTLDFVFDAPLQSAKAVTVTGLFVPRPMTRSVDEPDGVPAQWHQSLLWWAGAQALTAQMAEEVPDGLKDELLRRWRADLSRYRSTLPARTNGVLVARPDVVWT